MAEAHRAANDRGASKMGRAGLENDRLVKRTMLKPGVFADEDPQKHRVAWEIHGSASLELPGDGHEYRGGKDGQSFDAIPDLRPVQIDWLT
jgi:hypothetical protein